MSNGSNNYFCECESSLEEEAKFRAFAPDGTKGAEIILIEQNRPLALTAPSGNIIRIEVGGPVTWNTLGCYGDISSGDTLTVFEVPWKNIGINRNGQPAQRVDCPND
jgi:hypothetical protein